SCLLVSRPFCIESPPWVDPEFFDRPKGRRALLSNVIPGRAPRANRPTGAAFCQAGVRGCSAAEDLAGREVEVGGVVDVGVGAVVEGDGQVVVAAGHVD